MADADLRSSYVCGTTMVPLRHMAVNSSSSVLRLPTPEPLFPGAAALEEFPTASLELIQSRALLVRTDVKFIGRVEQLPEVLRTLAPHYSVIRVSTGCAAGYRSTYFDTPDLRCYHDHLAGRRIRHKVRIRHYMDRSLSFLELKSKRNLSVTDKHRLDLPYGTSDLTIAGREFLAQRCDLPVDQLNRTVDNDFRRITLIGTQINERVTIDIDIRFRHLDKELGLPGLMVLEVKQHPYMPRSPIMLALRDAHLRELAVSKYTVAIAELGSVRRNRLMPLLRTLHRTIA